MTYATQTDLLQRMTLAELTQLTDDTGTGQPNTSIVTAELEEASGTVDSYCRDRYAVPLQPSDTVTRITRDIAVFQLFSRKGQKIREVVRQRYEDAIALLKDIAENRASIDQPASQPTPQSISAGAVKPACTGERFTEHNLDGFV